VKVQRFEWVGAAVTAAAVRSWGAEGEPPVEVESIGALVREGGDAALLALTKRYDAPDAQMETVRVDPAEAAAALAAQLAERRELFARAATVAIDVDGLEPEAVLERLRPLLSQPPG